MTLATKSAVLQFLRENPQFHVSDLRQYVVRVTGRVAPASVGRVLRHLRQTMVINYQCTSRRKSLYRVLWVPPAPNGVKS